MPDGTTRMPAPAIPAAEVFANEEFELEITLVGDSFRVGAHGLARALGFRAAGDMVRNLPEDEKGRYELDRTGRDQAVWYVTEPGFYRVLGQRQPGRVQDLAMRATVQRFQDWIYRTVLPNLRKGPELSRRDLALMVVASEDARMVAEERAELAEAEADELRPAATAWTVMADADGDWSVREAAQALNNDPAISTGETRLFRYLRAIRWLGVGNMPYQSAINAERMRTRLTTWTDPDTRIERTKSQPRLTLKGITELHRMLGGTAPLQLTKQAELMAGMP